MGMGKGRDYGILDEEHIVSAHVRSLGAIYGRILHTSPQTNTMVIFTRTILDWSISYGLHSSHSHTSFPDIKGKLPPPQSRSRPPTQCAFSLQSNIGPWPCTTLFLCFDTSPQKTSMTPLHPANIVTQGCGKKFKSSFSGRGQNIANIALRCV